MVADMLVGFKALREKFTSRVIKERPARIEVIYVDGPMKDLDNVWLFRPTCRTAAARSISASISRFRNAMFEALAGQYFDRAFRKMVAAFEERAHAALRQQQFQRRQRRLTAHARRGRRLRTAAISASGSSLAAQCAGEHHRADRLVHRVPPSGPAIAADRHRHVGPAVRAARPAPSRRRRRSKPRRTLDDVARHAQHLRAWPRSNRSRSRGRARPTSRRSRSAPRPPGPPVQLSASATVRPTARFSSTTRRARSRMSGGSSLAHRLGSADGQVLRAAVGEDEGHQPSSVPAAAGRSAEATCIARSIFGAIAQLDRLRRLSARRAHRPAVARLSSGRLREHRQHVLALSARARLCPSNRIKALLARGPRRALQSCVASRKTCSPAGGDEARPAPAAWRTVRAPPVTTAGHRIDDHGGEFSLGQAGTGGLRLDLRGDHCRQWRRRRWRVAMRFIKVTSRIANDGGNGLRGDPFAAPGKAERFGGSGLHIYRGCIDPEQARRAARASHRGGGRSWVPRRSA